MDMHLKDKLKVVKEVEAAMKGEKLGLNDRELEEVCQLLDQIRDATIRLKFLIWNKK
jgi:hypothetical protein